MSVTFNHCHTPYFGGPSAYCPFPMPYQYSTGHGNLPDTQPGGRHGFLFSQPDKGYGVDLNGNGGYDRGTDGVLGFDLNRDGHVDKGEMQQSNERLKAFGGNYDLNGDGKVNFCERIKAQRYQKETQAWDHNRDGVLDTNEIAGAGGRMMIDHNRDGNFQAHEQHSPYSFPAPGFGRGSLEFVDPRANYSQVGHRGWGYAYF